MFTKKTTEILRPIKQISEEIPSTPVYGPKELKDRKMKDFMKSKHVKMVQ